MNEIYIRTPDHDESRGPFGIPELQSLGEAGQIDANTLYFDEDKEEWVPVGMNPGLHAEVFPERRKLELKVGESKQAGSSRSTGESRSVDDILAAAGAETKDTRHLRAREVSAENASKIMTPGLGLIMVLSAAFLLVPHFELLADLSKRGNFLDVFNYPFFIIGILDFLLALLLFMSVTQVFAVTRIRAMLGLGFGLYVGWSIGDPLFTALVGLSGLGVFIATLTQRNAVMIASLAAGIASTGFLAYLSIAGRFTGFLDAVSLGIIGPS